MKVRQQRGTSHAGDRLGDRSANEELTISMHSAFSGHPEIIYPFFCFQAEQYTVSKHVAVDRLGRSLSFAIGLLKQLRDQAEEPRKLPIMAFGAISIGGLWALYVAYKPELFYHGINCVSFSCMNCALVHALTPDSLDPSFQGICTIWTGEVDVEDNGEGVELLWLMERIKRWGQEVLRPQIQTWLIAQDRLSITEVL
jgi:hypothetical protein